MKIWFKHKKRESIGDDATAHRIANGIIARQRRLSAYLNGKVAKCSRRRLAIMLFVIAGGFAAYCIYLLATGINGL